MKKYIRHSRYVTYQGKQLKLENGETKSQAVSRYREQLAKEEADRIENKRLAKEERESRSAERRRTVRYPEGTVVLTKDGRYCQLYNGYYSEADDTVFYDFMPCNSDGKWDCKDWSDDDYRWSSIPEEIDQRDIQRKIR